MAPGQNGGHDSEAPRTDCVARFAKVNGAYPHSTESLPHSCAALGVSRTAQAPSRDTDDTFPGELPTVAYVELKENAGVPAAARKTTREAPTRVSVNPEDDGPPGTSVVLPHNVCAASITAAGVARAFSSVALPSADVAAAASISAAVALTVTPMRADRMTPTALTLMASTQSGHFVGITVTGTDADASTCPVPLSVMLQSTAAALTTRGSTGEKNAPTHAVCAKSTGDNADAWHDAASVALIDAPA